MAQTARCRPLSTRRQRDRRSSHDSPSSASVAAHAGVVTRLELRVRDPFGHVSIIAREVAFADVWQGRRPRTPDLGSETTLLLTPAGTVIVAGTVTAAVLLLEKATTAPPLGAGAVSATVAEAVEPPCTLVGLRLTELKAGAVTAVHPDSRTLTGAAEPSLTSTVQSAGGE